MNNKKRNYYQKRVPTAFSLRRKTIYAIKRICKEEGVNQSRLVDSVMTNYIRVYDKLSGLE